MNGRWITVILVLMALGSAHAAEFRFPMPEFESGYQHPAMNAPAPAVIPPVVDITVLVVALALTAFAALRNRSRTQVFVLSIASLCYFGFYRQGCICPIGSIQNVFEAATLQSAVPVVVAAFFFIPLLFALYFGRVFCAAVCPLGAVQELCAAYPVQVPRPIESVLSLLPYAYLGLAALAIWTGSGYIICRYDPFVGFFRQGGSLNMLLFGGALLILGIVVARPYCRFLCPYGVLLRWVSRFAKWHVDITPAECVQCRLCETSCPYGAIEVPAGEDVPVTRTTGRRQLARLLLAVPGILVVGALTGYMAHDALARLHPTVRLAERIAAEERGAIAEHTIDTDTFRAGKATLGELYAESARLRGRFAWSSALFGLFMGLVVSGKLIRLSVLRKSEDYTVDRGACVTCARCFAYCPVERPRADA